MSGTVLLFPVREAPMGPQRGTRRAEPAPPRVEFTNPLTLVAAFLFSLALWCLIVAAVMWP